VRKAEQYWSTSERLSSQSDPTSLSNLLSVPYTFLAGEG